jgi:DNA-binding LytR/AlgR family response regulator
MEDLSDKSLKPVALKTATGFRYFYYDEIIMFKAVGHNAECLIVGGNLPFKIYHSLSYLRKKYCNEMFCKCNKSVIVNLSHICCLETKTRKIILRNNIELKISESFLKSMRKISEDLIWSEIKRVDLH